MVGHVRMCRRRGISLIETMVTAVVVLIVVIGTMGFRYRATLDGRWAKAHAAAARVALVLVESWRGEWGDATFDPDALSSTDLSITATDTGGPDVPDAFTLLGRYTVALNEDDASGVAYYATLSWKDIESGLRALNVVVAWSPRAGDDVVDVDGTGASERSFSLTTYAQTLDR